jgi:ubiquinone/menaquinone biosynthesis C-methylase UbiE
VIAQEKKGIGMFAKSQRFYDAIYAWKDYAEEARRLKHFIALHKRSVGNTLLDVACGTGGHVPYLRDEFAYEGWDLDPQMLALARALPRDPVPSG